ncbi:uncharacterized protein LOC141577675 isoform X2 [Camelus bactrianus]|uniref:Uncharacterized protein LOC141577675 isoform X2 n=1 Tax=Camelus bactrianus TaxID=9837 RepID=A0AC58QB07_CAMBA
MSCDPVDAQHPPAEETDCLRYMKGEDTYYPHGAKVVLGVCCLYSRWARVALGIPVPEFLQYTRCLFPNLQNWNDVNHPAVHSMVHPRLELSGSKSISEGTYLKRNGFPDSEGQRKHQPGLEKENSISEPVLGDLTEITLVAQASDREHVPSCSQPQTSTDASYTDKDPGLGGGVGRRRFARCWTPLNHRKWAGCAEGAEAAAKAATEGAVPGQPVNLFPSEHLLPQFRRTPFSSLSFSWEVTF